MRDVAALPRVTAETPNDFFYGVISQCAASGDSKAQAELAWGGERGWQRSGASFDCGDGVHGPVALPRWTGELYLEMHRGTLTSQAAIKKGNRQCERACVAAEGMSVVAAALDAIPYPTERLSGKWRTCRDPGACCTFAVDRLSGPFFLPFLPFSAECWKSLLTQQFHDVLPGMPRTLFASVFVVDVVAMPQAIALTAAHHLQVLALEW